MASSTEESHEVKAIKLHISTIKSQISITTNNVSSAKSNMDAAIAMYAALQSQLDVSKKELKDVEKLLVEAEQRAAAVANVNNDVNVEGGRNKRRKVSPPPQDDDTNTNNSGGVTAVKMEDDGNAYDEETDNEEDSNDTNNDHAGVTVKKEEGNNNHAYDDETDKEDEDETKPSATNNVSAKNNNSGSHQSNDDMNTTTGSTSNNQEASRSSDASSTTAAAGQSTSSNDVNQVIVEGSGDSVVNGTYTKVVGQTHDGAPIYSKGQYMESIIIYRDSRSMRSNNWYISYWNMDVSSIDKYANRYGSPNNADSMTPPTDGWVTLSDGVSPAPKLRLPKNTKPLKLWAKHHPCSGCDGPLNDNFLMCGGCRLFFCTKCDEEGKYQTHIASCPATKKNQSPPME